MDTDRVDTDAPLNPNKVDQDNENNDEEEEHYQTDIKIPSLPNAEEGEDDQQIADSNHQTNYSANYIPIKSKASLDQINMKITAFQSKTQIQEGYIQSDSKINHENNETSTNKSNKQSQSKIDDQLISTNQIYQQKPSQNNIFNQAKKLQNNIANIEEEDHSNVGDSFVNKRQNQYNEQDDLRINKDENKHNYILQNDGEETKKQLFILDNQNEQSTQKSQKFNQIKKPEFQISGSHNEGDFQEFGEVEIKTIQIPKISQKKGIFQTIGIVKYMENSFLGKKKDSISDKNKTSLHQNKNSDSEHKDNEMIYLSFSSMQQSEDKPNQKEYVKNNQLSTFGNGKVESQSISKKSSQENNILFKESQVSSKEFKSDIYEMKQKKYTLSQIYSQQEREKTKSIVNKKKDKPEYQSEVNKKFLTYKKIKIVRRMIKIFEKFNVIKRFSLVPKSYFKFFGDRASQLNEDGPQKNIFEKLKMKIYMKKAMKVSSVDTEQEDQQISKLVLFQDNPIVLFIKVLVIICSFLQCFYIPTTIAFTRSFSPSQNFNILFTIIPSIIFIIDIYVNFNLAYFFNGKLICNRKQIASNYFFGSYWSDFISIVLQVFIEKSLPSLVVRIFVVRKELDRVLSTFQIQEKFYYAYRLIRLAMELLISCHILACTFILAASYSTPNWLIMNELQDQTEYIQYLNSLYYIIVTMTTIGYGDIHPVSTTEKIFTCVIAFLTSGLFAYNISTISSIVNDSIRKKLETKRKILSVSEYMTERQISRSVQNQVLQQLYYNMKTERRSPQVINQYLRQVSENLKGSLFNEYFGNILATNKYFKRKFSKQFLSSLVPKFKEEVFPPGHIIFKQGDFEERLIYVRKGCITLYLSYPHPTPIVQEYQDGKWFGLENFFTGDSRNCCARSQNFTSIVYIERKDFLEVLQSFPRDKEAYCMIKDKIKLSGLAVNLNCNICDSMFHQIHTCPYAHFAKKKEYIIQKNIYQLVSKREPTFVRRQAKYNSRTTNELVRYQLKNFRMTLLLLAEGFNMFEFQQNKTDSESIFENQRQHSHNHHNPHHLDSCSYNNSSQIGQNFLQGQNSMFPLDGSQFCNCTSPLQKITSIQPVLKNQSKFKDNVSMGQEEEELEQEEENQGLSEQESPLSVRKTRQSFKNEQGSVEYRSNEADNQKLNQNEEQKDQQQDLNQEQMNIQEDDKLMEQIVLNLDDADSNIPAVKKLRNKELIHFDTQESKLSFLNSQFKRDRSMSNNNLKRKTTFILKPQNMRQILKILPTQIETDQEFFSKYDCFKWENNEISVLKNEQQPSMNSISQLDGLTDQVSQPPPTININLVPNKSIGIGGNITQAQAQIIYRNLSVINEENQKEISEEQSSLLPLNSALQPTTNEQYLLMKILNDIEQIKQFQDTMKRETTCSAQKMETSLSNALHRAFTFQKSNQLIQQEEQNCESSARFGANFDDVSFGKRKTEYTDSRLGEDNKQSNENQNKEDKDTKNKLEIVQVQNDSQPFSFQGERGENNSNQKQANDLFQKANMPNFLTESPTKSSSELQQVHQNNLKSKSSYSNLELYQALFKERQKQDIPNQSEMIDPIIMQNYVPHQILNSNSTSKSSYMNQQKLKDKIEFQFFIAFERQNNWKTYFPIYNLSYITEKVIKNQKKKQKMDQIPSVKIVDSTISQNLLFKKPAKYRRLSELVQENKDRNNSIFQKSSQSTQSKAPNLFKTQLDK